MKKPAKMKSVTFMAFALVAASSLAAPQANAAIGLVSVVFNPAAGLEMVAGGCLLIGGGLAVSTQVGGLPGALIANFTFWPGVIILDQKVTELPPVTKQDLLDNGYSAEQADRIFVDAKNLNDRLSSGKEMIKITLGEDAESIREGLKTISSDLSLKVSPEFLDVYADHLSLAAQAK